MTFNTLKDAQMYSTNSNNNLNASNMHSNNTNIQINIYNLQMCTCTPSIIQSPNIQASKHQSMPQTCTYALPTRSNTKAPTNIKTFQDPLPNQQQSNL